MYKMLLKYREKAAVHESNPYLFALPQVKTNSKMQMIKFRHLSATFLIREFSIKCGAEHPETLRATQLRKHVATQSVSLNLRDNEISNLQSFLGHSDKIHRVLPTTNTSR